MSYYWFNRKEILQKAKERYSKEYYWQNKETIKEKPNNWYKILSKEETDKISAIDSVQKGSITK